MAGKSDVVVRFIGDTAGLDKAMGKAQTNVGKMGATFSTIGAKVGGEFGAMLAGVGEAFNQVGEHGKNMGMKLSVAGAVTTGLGLELQKMGSAPKQAMDQLTTAIKNSGSSIADYKEEIEKQIKTQQNFGHSELDTMAALQKLTQSTGSPKKALEQMGLVANLAAAQHISLSEAATMVSKVLIGKGGKALSQYGIVMQKTTVTAKQVEKAHNDVEKAAQKLAAAQTNLGYVHEALAGKSKLTTSEHIRLEKAQDKVRAAAYQVKAAQEAYKNTQEAAKDKTKDATKAIDQLSAKLHGQAAASVNNFSAKVGILKTKLGDWAGQMAGKLGPVLTAMGPLLMVLGALVQMNAFSWIKDTAAKVSNLAVTAAMYLWFKAIRVATLAWTAAQWLLNVALDANPIGVVVMAIAALVGGFILAYKKVKWFHDGVQLWMKGVKIYIGWIVEAAKWVLGWIVGNWVKAYDFLKGPISKAIDWIKTAWSGIPVMFRLVVGGLKAVFSGVFNFIVAPFKMAFNFVSDMWNKTLGKMSFKVPSWVPNIGGKGFSVPKLPHLAQGGIVTSPTIALIGEAGPEAVVPLGRGRGRGFGGGGDVHIHLHGGVLVGTPMENARALATMMQRAKAQGLQLGLA